MSLTGAKFIFSPIFFRFLFLPLPPLSLSFLLVHSSSHSILIDFLFSLSSTKLKLYIAHSFNLRFATHLIQTHSLYIYAFAYMLAALSVLFAHSFAAIHGVQS